MLVHRTNRHQSTMLNIFPCGFHQTADSFQLLPPLNSSSMETNRLCCSSVLHTIMTLHASCVFVYVCAFSTDEAALIGFCCLTGSTYVRCTSTRTRTHKMSTHDDTALCVLTCCTKILTTLMVWSQVRFSLKPQLTVKN